MKFDELDKKMRVFETLNDTGVLPGIYMVARIDGRGFTRLTKETLPLEAPFDLKFRDAMVETVKHLMNCGFNIVYGYTQSDEISLLFHINEGSFARKRRKYISVLAGEASACFSMQMGALAAFDCRLSELPNTQLVTDYFRWRNEDAHRNSLNAHCYWQLRKTGLSANEATRQIEKLSTAAKNELLFTHQINFNNLPAWQKRGVGLYWKETEKSGYNPAQEKDVIVKRRELVTDYNLPMKEEYSQFVSSLLQS